MNEQSTAPAQHPKDWCMGMDFFFFSVVVRFCKNPPSQVPPHRTKPPMISMDSSSSASFTNPSNQSFHVEAFEKNRRKCLNVTREDQLCPRGISLCYYLA